MTYGGVVTKDPDSGVMNVGIYRGMIADKNKIPILMWRAQHIGHHVTAWQQKGHKEMPIAVAIGWEPSLGFVAGSPVPKGLCEYDVIGAMRGAPVELVKCETVDLQVPATAEIVIEGYLGLDPETYEMEGPFAEVTGYVAGDRSPKPTIRVTGHHPPQGSDPARHHRRLDARQLFGKRHVLVDHARGDGVERARPRRRARHHRRLVPAGAGRREHRGGRSSRAIAARPSRWPMRCGARRRPCALQARHRGRRRHRHPRLRRGRLGDRLSRQCRRGRHRHHAGDLRRRARSIDAQARPQRRRCSAPANGIAC